VEDIAFDATFRAAAPFQQRRMDKRKRLAFAIEKSDLQRKVRASASPTLFSSCRRLLVHAVASA